MTDVIWNPPEIEVFFFKLLKFYFRFQDMNYLAFDENLTEC